ncbi:hypothetical protein CAL13_11310 [Bordetella genomosp. 9]|uniref:Molecular chaperone DnaJ n=1 Tax=Bordetella genomosp. 9 TaxID=1416803 RepID=A0A1W6Z060_9BORD|nr:hypothetical protein CAL13_11310 [Bordetella genomosp. 9]
MKAVSRGLLDLTLHGPEPAGLVRHVADADRIDGMPVMTRSAMDDAIEGMTIMADTTDPNMNPGDEAPPGTPGTGEAPCPECGGTGRKDDVPCDQCGGTGKIIKAVGGA